MHVDIADIVHMRSAPELCGVVLLKSVLSMWVCGALAANHNATPPGCSRRLWPRSLRARAHHLIVGAFAWLLREWASPAEAGGARNRAIGREAFLNIA